MLKVLSKTIAFSMIDLFPKPNLKEIKFHFIFGSNFD